MQDRVEFILLKVLSYILRITPDKHLIKLAKLLAFLFYHFLPIRKKIAYKNLKLAFPEFSDEEKLKIVYRSYVNLFLVLLEILKMPYLSKEEIMDKVKIDDFGEIYERIKNNEGLIFVSAHFGNWELLALGSALRFKKPFTIVVKPLRNKLVDNFINECRCKFGNKVIPMGVSVKHIYKDLLENKIIALLADQRASLQSLAIDFFNKKTHVYEGPAALAVKTNKPLYFAIGIRQHDFSYTVKLKKIEPPKDKDDREKIITMTKTYIHLLENYIREYPDQWLWFHDRWKH